MQKNSGIVLGLSCCKFLIALGNCFATTDKAKQLKKSKRSNTAIKIINPNATIIFNIQKFFNLFLVTKSCTPYTKLRHLWDI